jgi:hypothetical protein
MRKYTQLTSKTGPGSAPTREIGNGGGGATSPGGRTSLVLPATPCGTSTRMKSTRWRRREPTSCRNWVCLTMNRRKWTAITADSFIRPCSQCVAFYATYMHTSSEPSPNLPQLRKDYINFQLRSYLTHTTPIDPKSTLPSLSYPIR